MVSIGLALSAAVCNVRHQRRLWENDPERPDHPLLQPNPAFHGWHAMTEGEAAAEDERQRRPEADEAA